MITPPARRPRPAPNQAGPPWNREESTVARNNTQSASIKRRQLMLAGAAVAVMPAGLLAAECGGGEVVAAEHPFSADGAGQTLVLSGRILGFGCQPLAGAVIEVWQDDATRVRATTDGDGRFVLTTVVPAGGRAPHLSYYVTHPLHDLRARELYFTREPDHAAESVAQLERDEAGVWHAAFALTIV
jgi:protocatechuate 3,4-dioxygenase beta subunit